MHILFPSTKSLRFGAGISGISAPALRARRSDPGQ